MIKAVFIDVDGTLMSHSTHDVPHSARIAIQKLQEKGIKVCLATGRHINEIERLPLNDIKFDGYICVNGQLCLDQNREIYFASEIKEEPMKLYKQLFEEKKISFLFCGKDRIYVNVVNEQTRMAQEAISSGIAPVENYQGEPIYLIVAYANNEEEIYLKQISKGCKITRWTTYGIDVYDEYGGKEEGIRKFIELNDITEDEIMVLGDGENDMLMIQMAKIGIAMGNGDQMVKDISDYVTDDVDHDGLYNALKHFKLI